ncbi:MAG: nucleoside deaminase [Nitrospinae bacterium]|nr:nucleoside deaminase [Nitrospinota bacterium]
MKISGSTAALLFIAFAFTTPTVASADDHSDAPQPKTFYGYTPAQTQKWVDEAPDLPSKEFAVVSDAGSEGNVQCAATASKEQTEIDLKFIKRAIKLASHNPAQAMHGHAPDGGLFGAVIVKDGKILGEGWNTVLKEGDPSRHGEMNAIRQATHDNGHGLDELAGATLYTSGAPCPMCYSTMAWANVKRIVYASDYSDAMTYGGFKDEPIRVSLGLPIDKREWPGCQVESGLGRAWWEQYNAVVYKDGKGAKY